MHFEWNHKLITDSRVSYYKQALKQGIISLREQVRAEAATPVAFERRLDMIRAEIP